MHVRTCTACLSSVTLTIVFTTDIPFSILSLRHAKCKMKGCTQRTDKKNGFELLKLELHIHICMYLYLQKQ